MVLVWRIRAQRAASRRVKAWGRGVLQTARPPRKYGDLGECQTDVHIILSVFVGLAFAKCESEKKGWSYHTVTYLGLCSKSSTAMAGGYLPQEGVLGSPEGTKLG